MKNVVNKIITVLSGIFTKSDQIQNALQTVIMTNQQYQAINILCDQISARYFVIQVNPQDPQNPLIQYPQYQYSGQCNGGFLFECKIGDKKYSVIDTQNITRDAVFWSVIDSDGIQYTITVLNSYAGDNSYKYAFGIKQEDNIILDLNQNILMFLSIYNKGILQIINGGNLSLPRDIINYKELRIHVPINGAYTNIDNKGFMVITNNSTMGNIINTGQLYIGGGYHQGLYIKNLSGGYIEISSGSDISTRQWLQCNNGSNILITGGKLNGQISIKEGGTFNLVEGIIDNSQIEIYGNMTLNIFSSQQFQVNQIKLYPTGNLKIQCNMLSSNNLNNTLYLYGDKIYDYKQIADSEIIFYEIHCQDGASIINYSGKII